jgi:hypothetical protein
MLLLPFGIGLSDRGTWFAQPKAQSSEQTLALPHAQGDPVLPSDPSRQCFAVPYISTQT